MGHQAAPQATGADAEGEQSMNRCGWKVLATTAGTIAVLKAYGVLTTAGVSPWLAMSVADAIGAVGLVGYAWRVRVTRQPVWEALFVAYCMSLLVLVAFVGSGVYFARVLLMVQFPADSEWALAQQPTYLVPMALLVLALLAYNAIKAYGVFLYAHRSPEIWSESN